MNSMKDETFIAFEWLPPDERKDGIIEARGKFDNVADAPKGAVLIGVSAADDAFIGYYDVKAWDGLDLKRYRIQLEKKYENVYSRDLLDPFVSYLYYCLDLLYAFAPGRSLLEKLCEGGDKNKTAVVIALSPIGANQYMVSSGGEDKCQLTSVLGRGGEELAALLRELVPQIDDSVEDDDGEVASWLHTRVLQQPIWTNHGFAAIDSWRAPQNTELKAECRKVWNCKPLALSLEDFQAWLDAPDADALRPHVLKKGSGGDPKNLHEHLRSAVIRLLYGKSPPGAGVHSMVQVTPGLSHSHGQPTEQDLRKLAQTLRTERPPAVGLAHELIHAARAASGLQPDRSDTDIVLTEMACVGLGPWEYDPSFPTENALRRCWFIEPKLEFDGVGEDPVNQRRHPVFRPHYSWDESAFLARRPRLRPLTWGDSPSRGMACVLCKSSNNRHEDRVSSFLGRWHWCQACGKFYCNLCAKWKLSRIGAFERTRKCQCGARTTLIE